MKAYRIDVHHHILPREYVQALESIGTKELAFIERQNALKLFPQLNYRNNVVS